MTPPSENRTIISPPRFETGWWPVRDAQGRVSHYEAWRRPYSEDWYDLFPTETWWEALAFALALAARLPDCEFVGSSAAQTDHLDNPRRVG